MTTYEAGEPAEISEDDAVHREAPTPAETTGAVQRAAKALWQHEYDFDPASGITERDAPGFARAVLTAALDVEEMARAMARAACGPLSEPPLGPCAVCVQSAQRIRAAILGSDQ